MSRDLRSRREGELEYNGERLVYNVEQGKKGEIKVDKEIPMLQTQKVLNAPMTSAHKNKCTYD